MNVFQKLNIYPADQRKIGLCLLLAIAMNFAQGFLIVLPLAIFLESHTASFFPYIYIASSIISLLIGMLSQRLSLKFNVIRFFFFLLPLCFLPLFFSHLPLTGYWTSICLMVGGQLICRFIDFEFWNLMNQIFNLQEAKKFFGFFGAVSSLSTIIAQLLIPVLIHYVSESFLLLVAAIILILACTFQGVFRQYIHSIEEVGKEELNPTESKTESKAFKGFYSSYVLKLLLDTVLINGLYYFLDFAFNTSIQEHFESEEKMINFLSIFFGATSAIDVFARLLLTPYVISRFGIIPAILLIPCTIGIAIFFALTFQVMTPLIMPVFLCIIIAKFFDEGFRSSVADPAKLLMYQLLAPSTRSWIYRTSEIMVEPISAVCSSLVLIALSSSSSLSITLGFVFLLAFASIANTLTTKKSYLHTLKESLRLRYFAQENLLPLDKDCLDLCQKYLSSPYPGAVIYSLELLEKRAMAHFIEDLSLVIDHPHPLVKAYSLKKLEEHHLNGLADKVYQLSRDGNQPINTQAYALVTLAALAETSQQKEYLHKCLASFQPLIRANAIVGILKNPRLEMEEEAKQKLNELIYSAQPEERLQALRIYKELPYLIDQKFVESSLTDKNLAIQKAAVALIPLMSNRKSFFPLFISALDYSPLILPVIKACVEMGDEMIFFLLENFLRFPEKIKILFLNNLKRAKISKENKVILQAFFLEQLHQGSLMLDRAIWQLLLSWDYGSSDHIQKYKIDEEMTYYCNLFENLMHPLKEMILARNSLCISSLKGQLEVVQHNIFLLLSSQHSREVMVQILNKLHLDDQQQVAYAFELLSHLLNKKQAKIISLLSQYHQLKEMEKGQALFPTHEASKTLKNILLNDPKIFSDILRAEVLYTLMQTHAKVDQEMLDKISKEKSPLLQEILKEAIP